MRGWAASSNGAQPGDPVKAAVAIVDAVTAAEPPTRLQLGADAVARVEQKLAHVAAETERWRAVALSTAHDDVPAPSERHRRAARRIEYGGAGPASGPARPPPPGGCAELDAQAPGGRRPASAP